MGWGMVPTKGSVLEESHTSHSRACESALQMLSRCSISSQLESSEIRAVFCSSPSSSRFCGYQPKISGKGVTTVPRPEPPCLRPPPGQTGKAGGLGQAAGRTRGGEKRGGAGANSEERKLGPPHRTPSAAALAKWPGVGRLLPRGGARTRRVGLGRDAGSGLRVPLTVRCFATQGSNEGKAAASHVLGEKRGSTVSWAFGRPQGWGSFSRGRRGRVLCGSRGPHYPDRASP